MRFLISFTNENESLTEYSLFKSNESIELRYFAKIVSKGSNRGNNKGEVMTCKDY